MVELQIRFFVVVVCHSCMRYIEQWGSEVVDCTNVSMYRLFLLDSYASGGDYQASPATRTPRPMSPRQGTCATPTEL